MENKIMINKKEVAIEWGVGPGVGFASHAVAEADLDEGTADGPYDGQEFEIAGKKYFLGAHDYETNDGEVTCTAAIYELDED